MDDRWGGRGSAAGNASDGSWGDADPVDSGFSLVVTAISLLVTALLVLLLLSTAFKSNGGTKLADQPGVGLADDVQAQTSLETALSTAESAAAGSGGYGSLDAAGLAQFEPSLSFVDGPSTSSDSISVAGSASGAIADGASQDTGAVTLAARSSSGRCWLIWKDVSATWYGEQTSGSSCVATALASEPTVGTPTSSTVGWQQGGFPSST